MGRARGRDAEAAATVVAGTRKANRRETRKEIQKATRKATRKAARNLGGPRPIGRRSTCPTYAIVLRAGPGPVGPRPAAGPGCRRSVGRLSADRGAAMRTRRTRPRGTWPQEPRRKSQSLEGRGLRCRRRPREPAVVPAVLAPQSAAAASAGSARRRYAPPARRARGRGGSDRDRLEDTLNGLDESDEARDGRGGSPAPERGSPAPKRVLVTRIVTRIARRAGVEQQLAARREGRSA